MAKKQEANLVTAGGFIQFILMILFGVPALAYLFDGEIKDFIGLGSIAFLWIPWFNKLTEKDHNKKLSGGLKFVIMIVIIIIIYGVL